MKKHFYATVDRATNLVERIDNDVQSCTQSEFIDGVGRYISIPISEELCSIIREEWAQGRKFCMEDRV